MDRQSAFIALRLLTNANLDAFSQGFQVNSHAIGDRANTVLLDAYEQAMPATGGAELRLRIEHAQIMVCPPRSCQALQITDSSSQTIPDIERMGRMGVIASVQPTHGERV